MLITFGLPQVCCRQTWPTWRGSDRDGVQAICQQLRLTTASTHPDNHDVNLGACVGWLGIEQGIAWAWAWRVLCDVLRVCNTRVLHGIR